MKKAGTPSFISLVLIISILLVSIINGQTKTAAQRNSNLSAQGGFENSYYIEDLSQAAVEGRIRWTEGLESGPFVTFDIEDIKQKARSRLVDNTRR